MEQKCISSSFLAFSPQSLPSFLKGNIYFVSSQNFHVNCWGPHGAIKSTCEQNICERNESELSFFAAGATQSEGDLTSEDIEKKTHELQLIITVYVKIDVMLKVFFSLTYVFSIHFHLLKKMASLFFDISPFVFHRRSRKSLWKRSTLWHI